MIEPGGETWRIEVITDAAAVPAFETALDHIADAVLAFEIEDDPAGRWRLAGICREFPGRPRVTALMAVAAAAAGIDEPDWSLERLAARDWVAENLLTFPPMLIGRYYVYGSHVTGRVPPGRLPLLVDATTAFGSGEHQSTQGCLLALDGLARKRRFVRPLDMGCGTGILAMAAARTWHVRTRAADFDPAAVRVTRFNARRNGVAGLIRPMLADGFKAAAVRRATPFDLILANILARPLVSMAPRLAASLAPGGRAVLSGLLTRQERMILAAFRPQGLVLERRLVLAPWLTLVLKKP